MKIRNVILMMFVLSMLAACGGSKPKPPQITEEDFLTLADVGGRTTLKEDSPDVRVINVKAKAIIKKHNLREAKKKAMNNAAKMAVESMVRELMTTENFNKKYEEIERYFSKNIDKYILDRQAAGERKIYMDRYYGVYASFKISRQKVLVALQKDLKFIDASGSTLITVITSKKDLDLSGAGYRFSDIENMLMNQIQTDLNQRGLRAMDFRNAISSMQIDEKKKRIFAKISKEQFMAAISGSKPGAAAFNSQVRAAEEFYSTGLTLLKQLAKVVIEINILNVTKTDRAMIMGIEVTAKNISTATGGAFAHATFNVARKAGPSTSSAAMITELVKDTYADMKTEFIPQVIKEMSTIDVAGNKLIRYELVMKGFSGSEFRKLRKATQQTEDENFRYIDYDNTLGKAKPSSINIMFVRFGGKLSDLGDRIMDVIDGRNLSVEEPIIAADLTDLVFEKIKSED